MSRGLVVVGSKAIGLRVCRTVLDAGMVMSGVITLDDRADSRSALTDIVATADGRGVPIVVATSPQHAREAWQAFDAKTVIVAGWYWIIEGALLKGRTVVGFHNSLLPKYRGGSPLVWAMIRGEKTVGVSLFELVQQMDAGPLWGQARVDIRPEDYVSDVLERIEVESEHLLRRHLKSIVKGHRASVPQGEQGVIYCAQRQPSDGAIDWTWGASRIRDFIRAQSRPYPGAFTMWKGEPLRIWRAEIGDERYIGLPGQLVPAGIICGDDRLIIGTEATYQTRAGSVFDVIGTSFGRLGTS